MVLIIIVYEWLALISHWFYSAVKREGLAVGHHGIRLGRGQKIINEAVT